MVQIKTVKSTQYNKAAHSNENNEIKPNVKENSLGITQNLQGMNTECSDGMHGFLYDTSL